MSEKRKLSDIVEIEFKCAKCNAKIILDLNKKTTMPTNCCNCGTGFIFEPMDNPLGYFLKSVKIFESIDNLGVSLICKEVER